MRRAAWLLFAAVLPAAALAQQGALQLSSAPFDRSLFRDGEVRRLGGQFGRWTVVCDEITRMKQRYCSLRVLVADAAGHEVAVLDVSTGDDGRPAALLHLPLGVVLPDGVEVAGQGDAEGKKPAPSRRLSIAACDMRECQAVWSFATAEFQALTKGRGLTLRYRVLATMAVPVLRQQGASRVAVSGVIPADGFATAIQASLR
jgi:invasion protein IalB